MAYYPPICKTALWALLGALWLAGCGGGDDKRICAPKEGSGELLCRAAGSGLSGDSCTRSTQCQAAFYCIDERCQEWPGSESWDRDKTCITYCSGTDSCNFFMFDVCAGWHDFSFPELCLDGRLYRCTDTTGTDCCPGTSLAYQVVGTCGANTPGCDSDGDRDNEREDEEEWVLALGGSCDPTTFWRYIDESCCRLSAGRLYRFACDKTSRTLIEGDSCDGEDVYCRHFSCVDGWQRYELQRNGEPCRDNPWVSGPEPGYTCNANGECVEDGDFEWIEE